MLSTEEQFKTAAKIYLALSAYEMTRRGLIRATQKWRDERKK